MFDHFYWTLERLDSSFDTPKDENEFRKKYSIIPSALFQPQHFTQYNNFMPVNRQTRLISYALTI
jgi:hypothetical protein